MAAVIDDSEIDFGAYLEATDSAHKVRPASEFVDAVIDRLYGEQSAAGATLPWDKTHGQFRIRPGEVTVWTGWNSHRKSMVLGQIVLELCAQSEPTLIASMEMRPEATLARMARQAAGNESPAIPFIRKFHAWTDGRLWLYNHLGSVPWQKMAAVCRYAIDTHQIRHIVIDSLMKCGLAEDDYNGQKAFVDQLCVIARDNNAHIHLVSHAKKGHDEDAPPGKMDNKGTGTMADLVDNLVVVWANKKKEKEKAKLAPNPDVLSMPDQLLIVEKQRHGEFEGRIKLWFDQKSLQLLESEKGWPKRFIEDAPREVASVQI